jgi:SSS family solute:Na+ symporter
MLIINLNYWGCNQYITQRALELILKLLETEYYLLRFVLMPIIVVLPGIAALCCIKMGILEPKCQDGP